MALQAALEFLPQLLAATLIASPQYAFEPCQAVSGDTLRCAGQSIRVHGVRAAPPGSVLGDTALERLRRRIHSNTLRLQPRYVDAQGRVVASVYVGSKRYSSGGSIVRQRDVGPRPHQRGGRAKKQAR